MSSPPSKTVNLGVVFFRVPARGKDLYQSRDFAMDCPQTWAPTDLVMQNRGFFMGEEWKSEALNLVGLLFVSLRIHGCLV